MSKKRIAVIAGDGIGKEVMPEGVRVLDAAARKYGIDLQFDHFDFSSWDYFERHGECRVQPCGQYRVHRFIAHLPTESALRYAHGRKPIGVGPGIDPTGGNG